MTDEVKKAAEEYSGLEFDEHSEADAFYAMLQKDAFIAGAKWQAERLLSGRPLPEDTVLFNKGVEEGKRLMREEAVEAKIYGYDDGSYELIASWLDLPKGIYKDGDKVRIIVIPNTDEK